LPTEASFTKSPNSSSFLPAEYIGLYSFVPDLSHDLSYGNIANVSMDDQMPLLFPPNPNHKGSYSSFLNKKYTNDIIKNLEDTSESEIKNKKYLNLIVKGFEDASENKNEDKKTVGEEDLNNFFDTSAQAQELSVEVPLSFYGYDSAQDDEDVSKAVSEDQVIFFDNFSLNFPLWSNRLLEFTGQDFDSYFFNFDLSQHKRLAYILKEFVFLEEDHYKLFDKLSKNTAEEARDNFKYGN